MTGNPVSIVIHRKGRIESAFAQERGEHVRLVEEVLGDDVVYLRVQQANGFAAPPAHFAVVHPNCVALRGTEGVCAHW
jgi:hypothetical protein